VAVDRAAGVRQVQGADLFGRLLAGTLVWDAL
jgi:hypothetical protein